jgi:hypothetical protein
VGVTRRQARELLGAGLAGPPVKTSSAVLYEEAAVDALASWPVLTDDRVEAACPWGLFVNRHRLDTWAFSPLTSVWIRSASNGTVTCLRVDGLWLRERGGEITSVIPERGCGYRLGRWLPAGAA